MIANARMYSVSAAAAESWRQLFLSVAQQAGVALEVVEHPPPAPIATLWERADKGAVFMCGLPYSQALPRPQLLVAPVPSPSDFEGKAQYWTEFVVRADSAYQTLSDTWGTRIAFTTPESQSGFAAPLQYLSHQAGARPLYAQVIAPQLTPVGALSAVTRGLAEVAPIDAYAYRLMRHFQPALTQQVRSIARTAARPIPPLVASVGDQAALSAAFVAAHERPALRERMAHLLLSRFVRVPEHNYDGLPAEFAATLQYWRTHPLAEQVDEAFVATLGTVQ